MKRGEIWLINLDPTIGAEISKKRPALILNEDGVGRLPLRVIAPITNWKAHYHLVPWMLRLPSDEVSGLDKESSADMFQTRSISTKRMISKLGEATPPQMALAERGISVVFGLGDRPK
ncbi:type II toxin-antitoxin system PemK/MazF family toxin [Lewinella sp. JB7]|uniref:type II toxin-antitoxin system PemK/MazF family toxin n=1 Tax=Lewinella sp. JB7 TaxID=2962887 RepID=UPI0020C94115|nr:type II toxin-antitoxin system PemK/MazF family toxin [Lewinella sp. JB7]MCP9234759.1 type II toxin-antitoxin system PemK/MazF family toxin [Lewinella sp. JB7]